jgi:hypothetical protein
MVLGQAKSDIWGELGLDDPLANHGQVMKAAYREALVELLDTLVCDPILPAFAASQLVGFSDATVTKYRRIIAAKLAV